MSDLKKDAKEGFMPDENTPEGEAGKAKSPPQTKPPAPSTKPPEKTDAQFEKGNAEFEAIANKAAYVEADRLASLKKELAEMETRIDQKVQSFKKFVGDTEIQGRSMAGAAVTKTEDDEKLERARSLLKGTGLEDRIT